MVYIHGARLDNLFEVGNMLGYLVRRRCRIS